MLHGYRCCLAKRCITVTRAVWQNDASRLQVLFTYNKLVSLIEFHVAPGVDVDLVTSSLQRKVTTWAGVTCPEHSRFAMTPFVVVEMDIHRQKRSVELSEARNRLKASLYDWERDWLNKMF